MRLICTLLILTTSAPAWAASPDEVNHLLRQAGVADPAPGTHYTLRDDGAGAYVDWWAPTNPITKPTPADLTDTAASATYKTDLAQRRAKERARELERASRSYITTTTNGDSRYPDHVLIGLLQALRKAEKAGAAAKAARLTAVDTWLNQVQGYYYTKKSELGVAAATGDPAQVEAVTWDFAQFDATDPGVTLLESAQ